MSVMSTIYGGSSNKNRIRNSDLDTGSPKRDHKIRGINSINVDDKDVDLAQAKNYAKERRHSSGNVVDDYHSGGAKLKNYKSMPGATSKL